MIEVTLPCCDSTVVVEPDASEVECEACGLVLDLAPDARLVAAVTASGPSEHRRALPTAA